MIRGNAILAAALLLLAAAPARAGIERAGTTAANFLQVGTGAGALGMAGATLGMPGGDLGSITWNAASLAHLRETRIAFSHVGLAQSSAQEWAAVAGQFRTLPMRWAISGLYQGDGSFEGRDALGNPTGDFSASSMAFAANGAYSVMRNVHVGLGIKYVSEALGDVHGSGLGFDLGVQATQGRWGFGAALQNVGGKMRYEGASYPFASAMGAGVSVSDPATGLRAALDFNIPNAYYQDVRAGVEWMYHDRFALRTGYRLEMGAEENEPMTGPTFGLGAGANGFWFDYALMAGGASGDGQHRVGITFQPGVMNLGGIAGGGASAAPVAATAKKPAEKPVAARAPKKKDEKPAVAKASKKSEEQAVAAKVSKKKNKDAPIAAKVSKSDRKKSQAGMATVPSAAVKIPVTPVAPLAVVAAPKPAVTKSSEPIQLDTAPPRATEPAKTAPVVAKPVEAPKPAPVVAKPVEAPKPAPVEAKPVVEAPKPAPVEAKPVVEAPKPAPVEAKPVVEAPKPVPVEAKPVVEAPKPAPVETKPVETPKPAEAAPAPVAVVTPSVESPKPAEPAPVPVVEAPKPVERKPEVAKAEPAKPAVPRPTHVVVKKGQSLEDIAKEWGTSAAAIMMENNIVTTKTPKPGTKLKLPPRR